MFGEKIADAEDIQASEHNCGAILKKDNNYLMFEAEVS
jgi:hypothetical protein